MDMEIGARTLFRSWASPPASVPMDSSLWARRELAFEVFVFGDVGIDREDGDWFAFRVADKVPAAFHDEWACHRC